MLDVDDLIEVVYFTCESSLANGALLDVGRAEKRTPPISNSGLCRIAHVILLSERDNSIIYAIGDRSQILVCTISKSSARL